MTPSNAAAAGYWRFTRPFLQQQPKERCRILFAGPHFQAALGYTESSLKKRRLWPQVELIHAPTTADLMKMAPTVHVALPFMERFTADFLQAAPQLRLVQQFGVGLEGVDLEEASQQGIAVSNVPAQGTGNAFATAEHAIFLTISLLRRTPKDLPRRFQSEILGGMPPPKTLYGQNVTVVGFGNVGQQICHYCQVMGANVTAVRRTPWEDYSSSTTASTTTGEASQIAAKLVRTSTNLEEVLPTTNVLILACPVTPGTFHLLNEATLSLLPDQALVINVGRGPLVEYTAMYNALASERLGGFASDVGIGHEEKPSEPWDPTDPICNDFDNVLFTPHVGGYSELSYHRMTEVVVDHIECILQQKPPGIWVNRPTTATTTTTTN